MRKIFEKDGRLEGSHWYKEDLTWLCEVYSKPSRRSSLSYTHQRTASMIPTARLESYIILWHSPLPQNTPLTQNTSFDASWKPLDHDFFMPFSRRVYVDSLR